MYRIRYLRVRLNYEIIEDTVFNIQQVSTYQLAADDSIKKTYLD